MTSSLQVILDDAIKKQELLNLSQLSDVESSYSLSALTIFKERYLLKRLTGEIDPKTGEPIYETCERLDDLFKRVAVASGIMDVLYSGRWYKKDGNSNTISSLYIQTFKENLKRMEHSLKDLDYKDINNHPSCFKIGDFTVNPFHILSLMSRYIELAEQGKMLTTFENILFIIREYEHKDLVIKAVEERIARYYELMVNKIFLPNTPCLMNAGTKLNQNAACFTLRMKDDLEDIYKTYADIAKVFKSGGGIGINYSELRPEGAFVSSTGGKSSGTISWLKGTDETTGRVAQGGKRRGASMGILNMDHPEILKFINLKDNKTLHNHNISICTPNSFFTKFFSAGQDDDDNKEKGIMQKVIQNVWNTGDPGMVFLENMNDNNLLYPIFNKPIDVTNPCSEISMYPYDSCILASINLSKFIFDNKFDLEEYINVTRDVTNFLDGIIDATKYPLPQINEMTKNCRRIGVGYMGLADTLAQLEIPYNSKEGFIFTEYITAVLSLASLLESNAQARLKGSFPLWYDEKYPKDKLPIKALLLNNNNNYKDLQTLEENCPSVEKYISYRFHDDKDAFLLILQLIDTIKPKEGMRNCSTTTVAPTGTLSMMADCSSGIEPLFSLGYTKKVTLGEFDYVDKNLIDLLKKHGLYSPQLVHTIIKDNGGILSGMEEDVSGITLIKNILPTAMEIHPYDHIMMQASAQKWITNGISKTINGQMNIPPKLIEYSYVLAWALGNKGITVFRDGCKSEQVLNASKPVDLPVKASDYTINQIKLIDTNKIPEEYKRELIEGANLGETTLHWGAKITDDEVKSLIDFYDDSEKLKLECVNCGHVVMQNRYASNIKACFICNKCGNSVGSCS